MIRCHASVLMQHESPSLVALQVQRGRFLAPRTTLGIRGRNRFIGSRAFRLMMKYADNASNDIELHDTPCLIAMA